MTTMGDDPLIAAALLEQLQVMRAAERDIFGSLDPATRDRPMRPNDWSPKDHQAHLTAWKGIQAERIRAGTRGEDPPFVGTETLAEFAREDPDLVELRDELPTLVA